MISLLAALILGCANAAELSNDSSALRACRYMPVAADRNTCTENVRGHKFDSAAVEVCARGRETDSEYGVFAAACLRQIRDQEFYGEALAQCQRVLDGKLMDCLRLIAGLRTADRALFHCHKVWGDEKILECVRKVAWTPIREPSRPAATVTGGADGAQK